jgi:hypothetical protein
LDDDGEVGKWQIGKTGDVVRAVSVVRGWISNGHDQRSNRASQVVYAF